MSARFDVPATSCCPSRLKVSENAEPTGVATEPASDDEGVSPVVWIVLAVVVLGAAGAGAVWYRRRSA